VRRRLNRVGNGQPSDRQRRRLYFWIMGPCLGLIVVAWTIVQFFSITAAVVMSVVAMVMPPIAAIAANAGQGS
jgi:uncharacterized Tic20 family protein